MSFWSFIYPHRCVACGAVAETPHWQEDPEQSLLALFCDPCSIALSAPSLHANPLDMQCIRCGKAGITSPICGGCLHYPPPFRFFRAVYQYNELAAAALRSYKYQSNRRMGAYFAQVLTHAISEKLLFPEALSWDLLLPIPSSPDVVRNRGWNPLSPITRRVAASLNLPCSLHSLRSVRCHPRQAELTQAKRRANLRGAFQVTTPALVAGARVLLLDDVVTTGTTITEASKALQKAGAQSVDVVALAKTDPKNRIGNYAMPRSLAITKKACSTSLHLAAAS